VDRRLARRLIEGPPQRLAIDGHDLTIADLRQGRDPTQQALFELGGLEQPENGVEPVMRGDARRQVEELRQPLPFCFRPVGDGDKVVGAADHGADGDRYKVYQRILALAATRISEFREVIEDTGGDGTGHRGFLGSRPTRGLQSCRKSSSTSRDTRFYQIPQCRAIALPLTPPFTPVTVR
jgi:hypothetical protein